MTSPLLSCRNVSKSFGALAAVKDMSFDLAVGEVLGIGGPNGAGKTTLFEVVSGFKSPDQGEIVLDGRRIDDQPPHIICHLGVGRIFQSNVGFDTLTVLQNVLVASAYGPASRGLPPLRFDAAMRQNANEALDFVGLRRSSNEVVRDLPVLDRKLLMIATALSTSPKLLLLDEPVGGLNPGEIDLLMSLVRKIIARGITIMVIEHVMRFLIRLSTRVMIMHHGEKIYAGTPKGMAEDETVKRVYLGDAMSRSLAEYAANGAG